MRNKLIIITLFVASVFIWTNAITLDLDTSSISNSQSVSLPAVPDSINLNCLIEVEYNFEGCHPSWILNVQLILTDSVALYKAKTKEHYHDDEYIIITLNKRTADCFKALLYDLYSTHHSVIKDKYLNETHAICSASSEWHIKLSINGKIINETIDIIDFMTSFDNPFNIQFDQIIQLVRAITNKIERDILQLEKVKPETAEWITETFHDEYYLPYNDINSYNYQ